MQDLTVIGIENGSLLVASEAGERYRVAIDEVLQSRLRQSTTSSASGVKVSPREIQSQIRAGMSAEDVARSTGASLEYVERFEGPVVAERLHIVSSALKVPVTIASSIDPLSDDQSSTFGETIEERLAALDATDLRWASWKEEAGWVVKLTFTASEIDHDARWQYEPKRHTLAPLNSGAITLSQHGEIADGLIPRLRAVDPRAGDRRAESSGPDLDGLDSALDDSVDSGVETAGDVDGHAPDRSGSRASGSGGHTDVAASITEPTPFSRGSSQESSPAATAASVRRATPPPAEQNETADLLEALRRRRGEREAASFLPVDDDDEPQTSPGANHPSHGRAFTGGAGAGVGRGEARPVALLGAGRQPAADADTPLPGLEEPEGAARDQRSAAASPRKRRTSMPSWDEIVFGARSDDDLT